MSNSEENVFIKLRQSSIGNSFGHFTATDFCVSRPTSHIANQDVVISSPVKIKRRHHLFRQWIIMRGYAIYSPKKNKGDQDKWKISVIFCLIGLKNLLLYVGPFLLKWLPISVAFVSEIRLDKQMNNDYYPLQFFFFFTRDLKTPSCNCLVGKRNRNYCVHVDHFLSRGQQLCKFWLVLSRFRAYRARLEQGVMGIFLPSHHIPRATWE